MVCLNLIAERLYMTIFSIDWRHINHVIIIQVKVLLPHA
jgi:hypothetical protein